MNETPAVTDEARDADDVSAHGLDASAAPLDDVHDAAAGSTAAARRTSRVVAAAVVGTATLIVFWALQPRLIFANNTPTGGDMGAHVYGPAYLRVIVSK